MPERISGLRPALNSMCGKLTVWEPGSETRLPRWSYIHRPMRIIQTGRMLRSCGSTKRMGRTMWGAALRSTSRSSSASRTSRNS